jgi:hypothetical protein
MNPSAANPSTIACNGFMSVSGPVPRENGTRTRRAAAPWHGCIEPVPLWHSTTPPGGGR